MKPSRAFPIFALAVAALAFATDARAFCATRGCDAQTTDCVYDLKGCLITGPQLHWASSCVSYDVHEAGSPLRGISYAAAQVVVSDAFAQWLRADCGGGAGPSIAVADYGPVSCDKPEYNQDSGNANIIMFRDETWPYENAVDTLALTTLIFDPDTGEIYDADIEVNTFKSNMAIGNVGRLEIDFASVITHEIGHFLGLSHSNEPGATMRPSYSPGNTSMASLEADDFEGICAVLPPGRAVTSSSCEPRHGFSSECALADTGCSAGRSPASSSGVVLLMLSAAALRLMRRRFHRSAQQA
jgi:hypothetical protein